ncbi:alpha/beta hydrolase [Saccharopolyspora sp. NPDC002686]|uniref:alpha/beta hydrolase n=1 Tax=Saccharopolyspora sp. NPDC002686 TaxID=3154541 RepID=UPI0033234C5F
MVTGTIEHITFRNPDMHWDIAADLHFPPDFDESKTYPAIVAAHPIGSCKEQTSGSIYAPALAEAGYVVIAFDASFQGASGGEPRFLEDPAQRVQDFSRVVDHLVTLPHVDADRIGVLGICGGGGYTLAAAKTEKRFKAVVSITGANFGRLQREIAGQNGGCSRRSARSPSSALRRRAGSRARSTGSCRRRPRPRSRPGTSTSSRPSSTTAPIAARRSTAASSSRSRTARQRWDGMRSTWQRNSSTSPC